MPTVMKKKTTATKTRDDQVLKTVGMMTLDGATKKVAEAQVKVQETLGSLGAQMTAKLDELRQVEEAIALKKQDLQTLHHIEATADTMAQMELAMADQRAAWDREQAQRNQQWKDDEVQRATTLQRAADQRQYEIALRERQQQDAFVQALQARELPLKERETAVAAAQQELADLRAAVERFPKEMETAVATAVATATGNMRREHEMTVRLKDNELATTKTLASQQVEAATARVTMLEQQVTTLRGDLDKARADVTTISQQALNSASGRQALDAVMLTKGQEPAQQGRR